MTLNSAIGVVVLALALPWILVTHGDYVLESLPLFSDAVMAVAAVICTT